MELHGNSIPIYANLLTKKLHFTYIKGEIYNQGELVIFWQLVSVTSCVMIFLFAYYEFISELKPTLNFPLEQEIKVVSKFMLSLHQM